VTSVTGVCAQGARVKVFSTGACPAENDWNLFFCLRQKNQGKPLWFSLNPFQRDCGEGENKFQRKMDILVLTNGQY
jgi:hypothetical protein